MEHRPSRIGQLPNILTASRLVAVAGMLAGSALGAVGACLAFGAWALLSDALDGPLARRLGVASERGARFDSLADCALYLSAPWIALGVSPWLRTHAMPVALTVFVAYAGPVCYGMLKFRRLTSYHTTAAKVSGVVLAIAAVAVFLVHVVWPLYAAAIILLASAVEEIAITRALAVWRAEVPSFFSLSTSTPKGFQCRDLQSADSPASASFSVHSR